MQEKLNLMKCADNMKLDRVGPIDNRPSTEQFHHSVQKEEEEKIKKRKKEKQATHDK